MHNALLQRETGMDAAASIDAAFPVRIPLTLREPAGFSRRREPVVAGVPLPRGAIIADYECSIRDCRTGGLIDCQTQPLAKSPDDSLKWLSIVFLADIDARETAEWEVCIRPAAPKRSTFGAAEYTVPVSWLFKCFDARGREHEVRFESHQGEVWGPLRRDVQFQGRVRRSGGLRIGGVVSSFDDGRLLRVEATLQNPGRAKHAGGLWDLGDPGSVLLKGWRLEIDLSALEPQGVAWLESNLTEMHRTTALPWRICQYSSGGENWNSRNHVNRHNVVTLRTRGYRCYTAGGERVGLRASPVVTIEGRNGALTCAVPEFWQKFPTAINCDSNRLAVEFWPSDYGDLHELQAGEHCTRVVWLRFDADADSAVHDLAWVHEPLVAQVDPDWLAASNAIPWLPASSLPTRPEARILLREALEGPPNLFAKREVIDEFGWRNFGDVWADHEEAYYHGPKPIISHYNNQYDLLYGLLIQYLMSGDRRWWQLADPLARHVMDIDVYHTDRDKSLYSGGLFWHTAHYLDAATSSHRTYSKRMKGPSGGPANEHAYSSGLLLYFYLTGECRAKETVLQLAEWIITIDDGSQHVLGLLIDAPTGRASCTTRMDYHGPGRGAGNAIGVLLDAWLIGANDRYIDFAEVLIRRTVHPHDDIASRNLNDFEHRWSYTVYLQQLARYLLLTNGAGRPNGIRDYVTASLVQYADWMVDNDLSYLDYPEKLEYPTETWAVQELRKGNVLFAAAQFVDEKKADRFRQRAQTIIDRAWQRLMGFDSRSCTRPMALFLQQGFIEQYFSMAHGTFASQSSQPAIAFNKPSNFRTQNAEVRAAMKSLMLIARISAQVLRPARWWSVLRRTNLFESLRRRMARYY
jgi:hypothetical protein